MIPTSNGDRVHDWFYPPQHSSNYSINPRISEEHAITAYTNLQMFVYRLENSGVDYRYVTMPRDTFYSLASYCMDLGEQISRLVGFEKNNPYKFNDQALDTCVEILVSLRNRIAHELSIGVRPERLYATAFEIVSENYYLDAMNVILYELHKANPQNYNFDTKYVRRPVKKKGTHLFSKLF